MEYKPFMRPREAAKYTGIALNAIRAGIKRGQIPVFKSGKTNYIDMERFLNKRTPPGESVSFSAKRLFCADTKRENVG